MLNLKEESIAKTCILKIKGSEFIAVVLQGTDRINQKLLKVILRFKKCRFATSEEVLENTGYFAGGTPPIGLAHGIKRVLMDKKVFNHASVIAGGGKQEALIKITPSLIQALSSAEVVEITES